VTPGTFFSFLPLLLGMVAMQPQAVQTTVTRLVVQDEVILRVPIQPRPVFPRVQWVEKKGPKCIPVDAIRRGMLSGPEQVDILLMDRTRIRAQFDEDCLGLDFYEGFYLQPEDDRLCAKRDTIRSRMGTTCRIERFKRLFPKLDR
jgi:hypothetical protein